MSDEFKSANALAEDRKAFGKRSYPVWIQFGRSARAAEDVFTTQQNPQILNDLLALRAARMSVTSSRKAAATLAFALVLTKLTLSGKGQTFFGAKKEPMRIYFHQEPLLSSGKDPIYHRATATTYPHGKSLYRPDKQKFVVNSSKNVVYYS